MLTSLPVPDSQGTLPVTMSTKCQDLGQVTYLCHLCYSSQHSEMFPMVVTFESQGREPQKFISFPRAPSLLGPTGSQGCVWEMYHVSYSHCSKTKNKTLIIVSHHRPDIVLGTYTHATFNFHSNSIREWHLTFTHL